MGTNAGPEACGRSGACGPQARRHSPKTGRQACPEAGSEGRAKAYD
jgi:hypothetical protein